MRGWGGRCDSGGAYSLTQDDGYNGRTVSGPAKKVPTRSRGKSGGVVAVDGHIGSTDHGTASSRVSSNGHLASSGNGSSNGNGRSNGHGRSNGNGSSNGHGNSNGNGSSNGN